MRQAQTESYRSRLHRAKSLRLADAINLVHRSFLKVYPSLTKEQLENGITVSNLIAIVSSLQPKRAKRKGPGRPHASFKDLSEIYFLRRELPLAMLKVANSTGAALADALEKEDPGFGLPFSLVANLVGDGRTAKRCEQMYHEAERAMRQNPRWFIEGHKARLKDCGVTPEEYEQERLKILADPAAMAELEAVGQNATTAIIRHFRSRRKRGKNAHMSGHAPNLKKPSMVN